MSLTAEQKATNWETMQHIRQVAIFLHKFSKALLDRADVHDQSKLSSPEVELFTEYTPKLSSTTYGSKEYEEFRKLMSDALQHHYAKNRHHPEHFFNGINGMNLIDLVEMICDWKASTMRHNDGNLLKSIQHNTVRFGISPQLAEIMMNTAELFDE